MTGYAYHQILWAGVFLFVVGGFWNSLPLLSAITSTSMKNVPVYGESSKSQEDTAVVQRQNDHEQQPAQLSELGTGWWAPYVNSTARVFRSLNNELTRDRLPWCIPVDKQFFPKIPPATEPVCGLVYVKTYKASSSTCQGINAAIAHHAYKLQKQPHEESSAEDQQKCLHYDDHKVADGMHHGRRDYKKSLLWTFVRQPKARDMSHVFFFRVSRGKVSPNDTNVLLPALESQKSYQTKYLAPTKRDVWAVSTERWLESPKQATLVMKRILQTYDFIGITERMAESLAVMTLLWDLDPSWVVVLSAKQSSLKDSYDAGGSAKKCTKLTRVSNLHPSISAYLESEEYPAGHADFLLYEAVHKSLDLTIESLGKERVLQRATLIQELQAIAEDKCRPSAIFPCSSTGVYQGNLSASSCYVGDAGCGYPCVDKLMSEIQSNRSKV